MLALFTNRIAVAQLVALLIAGLVAGGIVPTGIAQAPIVALVMMAAAVVSAVLRFGHPGAPAADAKAWYLSRVIWVQIVAFVFALLAFLGRLPAGVEQVDVVTTILAVVAAASAVLGANTTRAIG